MNNRKREKGITIIVLVITMIVILILAGVTMVKLTGKNGIIKQTKNAKKMSDVSSEKEAIQVELLDNAEKLDEKNEYNIGKPLYDKTLENAKRWDIIVINNTLEKYGTNWGFIAKGTEIPQYGEAQYEWLVNYETGKCKQLEEEYTELSYKTSLAVTDGLLFNMDATNITSDISNWGNNVTLRYFDNIKYNTIEKRQDAYNEEKKYLDVSQFEGYDRKKTSNLLEFADFEKQAFKFNGNNYIEIYNQNGFDFSNGFTIELYGNFKDYVGVTEINIEGFLSMLGIWNGKYNEQCNARFGYYKSMIYYSLQPYGNQSSMGSWSDEKWPWNQKYEYTNFTNNDIYLTIVFKTNGKDQVTQSIYVDGILLDEGWMSYEYYDKFLTLGESLKYIELGRCTMGSSSNWCYTQGTCYAARIYNKSLNSNEVSNNVMQTKIYRQTLKNN